jgi:hypothetical protein
MQQHMQPLPQGTELQQAAAAAAAAELFASRCCLHPRPGLSQLLLVGTHTSRPLWLLQVLVHHGLPQLVAFVRAHTQKGG